MTGGLVLPAVVAALLPMLLATLGAVFAKTGVGDAVAQIVSAMIPTQSRDACVFAYGIGGISGPVTTRMVRVVIGGLFPVAPSVRRTASACVHPVASCATV